MSEFDEEAERERLRRKYEQDKQEREATERMSELLLQGATMTNAHCSACGNPIFRYEGQEFCATCERPVDREDGDDSTENGTGDSATVEVTSPEDDTRVVFGGEGDGSDTGRDDPDGGHRQAGHGSAGTDSARSPADQTDTRGQSVSRDEADAPTDDDRTGPPAGTPPESPVTDAGRDDATGLETARASLVRVLTAASRRAESADDPRRAREHVEVAREAAEALAALRR